MQNHPVDGPVDGSGDGHFTGLLTRFVPHSLRTSFIYRWCLRLTRFLQLLSSVISLGLFSRRFYNVYRLVNAIKTRRGVNGSFGAVEGILAAAVLYTLLTTLLSCIMRSSSPGGHVFRWILVLFDLAFVGAFIAVTVLTRPDGGKAGPHNCYSTKQMLSSTQRNSDRKDDTCDLPWGTFILAIISTILHAITAAFHEVREYRRGGRSADTAEKATTDYFTR